MLYLGSQHKKACCTFDEFQYDFSSFQTLRLYENTILWDETYMLGQHNPQIKQDSRDSSPKPSSNILDSLYPNTLSISAILKNAQQCSTMFKNALKYSDMRINAQQCSEMLKNFEIEHFSILAI